ncbi:hypothetical protein SELMODRAFT_95056 [Selaginella moellendorffii]|uniref:Pentacotripeptide-repeat region of PRORP domain-containing protein n=1 Tax=Selaginella moellendorffii TaxID=88036 RepID=D8RIP6_SELML|nr:hypothetical protein SELMODRAFT_95056 [Selaginella moellendorffii]
MDIEGTTPTKVAFLSVLEACAATGSVKEGRQIHAEVQSSLELSRDAKIQTAIVNFYGKCGLLVEARSMLDAAEDRCIVSTNAMISAYVKHGQMDRARELFDSLESPNVSTWNSMIKGYAQLGHIATAVDFLKRMDLDGIQPNTMTLLTLFDACATIPAPAEGKLVHASVDRGVDRDGPIATALVYMYGRSGGLDAARAIFDRLPDRDVAPWTAMIASYAHNGHGAAALELFQRMALDGSPPNAVTFNTILCAHAGLMDPSWDLFVSSARDYSIRPAMEHYVCIVDLLARVGRLSEARDLIARMPFHPDPVAWTALLGACKLQEERDLGEFAAAMLVQLNSENDSPYVVLSHLYSKDG